MKFMNFSKWARRKKKDEQEQLFLATQILSERFSHALTLHPWRASKALDEPDRKRISERESYVRVLTGKQGKVSSRSRFFFFFSFLLFVIGHS